ncbi:hypothetical protein [Parafrankia discariae]|uniref:hypothetical protein n=1 Tax=Parafrankia discariae TaxID=365528 RepID=UPI0003674E5C|nr:hypothetical protein [Parafrankia discariae]
MPADNAYPGPGPGPGSRSGSGPDPAFEQTLRELFHQATRSVTAPADLTARVCAPGPSRQGGRRRALVLAAAALATSSVILGGLAVERHLPSDRELNVIMPADGRPLSRPGTGAAAPTGAASMDSAPASSAPTGGVAVPPTAAQVPPDRATVEEITRAFTEAFDADDSVDDGLAYVQDGERYHDITRRFAERYPGVTGNLRVRLENITLTAGDTASATIVITHSDPKLGAQWGYRITREVQAVRVDSRWLVSSSTYAFLVGSS